jgi:WhiB family transcriptional regulator, redox-sensing transcriptional regulator
MTARTTMRVSRGYTEGAASLAQLLNLPLAANTTWVADALCAQTDPDAFFPEKGGSTSAPKSVCGRCPVRTPCLEYALEHNERHGVWGGKSEPERRVLLRQRRAATPGATTPGATTPGATTPGATTPGATTNENGAAA